MEPFEIMISESQERMLCVIEPARLPELLEICERWEVRANAIGEVTDTGALRVFDGDELVGDMPVAALVDDVPALRPRAGAAHRAALSRPAGPPGRGDADAARAAGPARLGQRGLQALRVRAVRLDRGLADGAAAGGRRRGGAPARGRRRERRDRGVDRRQRPARGLRPLHGRGRGGARVRAQPRLRRRRAARPDQLPQLRQPREAAHRLAAHARGGGPAGRLPRARRAGRGRQRLALQRGRRGPDLPDARSWAWSARLPDPERVAGRRRSPRRATRSRWSGRSRRTSPGSELEKLRGRLADGLPAVDLAAQAEGLAELRAAVRAGGLATVHDVSEGGAGLRARRVLHRRRDRRARGPGSAGRSGRP